MYLRRKLYTPTFEKRIKTGRLLAMKGSRQVLVLEVLFQFWGCGHPQDDVMPYFFPDAKSCKLKRGAKWLMFLLEHIIIIWYSIKDLYSFTAVFFIYLSIWIQNENLSNSRSLTIPKWLRIGKLSFWSWIVEKIQL